MIKIRGNPLVKVFYSNSELADFAPDDLVQTENNAYTQRRLSSRVTQGRSRRKGTADVDDLVYQVVLLPQAYLWQNVTQG